MRLTSRIRHRRDARYDLAGKVRWKSPNDGRPDEIGGKYTTPRTANQAPRHSERGAVAGRAALPYPIRATGAIQTATFRSNAPAGGPISSIVQPSSGSRHSLFDCAGVTGYGPAGGPEIRYSRAVRLGAMTSPSPVLTSALVLSRLRQPLGGDADERLCRQLTACAARPALLSRGFQGCRRRACVA